MQSTEVLIELFDRIPGLARPALDGLIAADLRRVPVPGANPMGWLVWHLARIQDQQVAEVAGTEQVWVTGNWAEQTGIPAGPADTGFGYTREQVAAIRPRDADALRGYLTAVTERTKEFLRGLEPAELDRVVDETWEPPVTLGVRLVSVAEDDLQHVGQAAYLRGLL